MPFSMPCPIVVNTFFALVPVRDSATIQAMMMRATSSPYSIAVTPRASRRSFRFMVRIWFMIFLFNGCDTARLGTVRTLTRSRMPSMIHQL